MPSRRRDDLKHAIADAGPLGTVLGAVLGAGVLYVIGGAVELVRLAQANLPVEQGLDVAPREQLLLMGGREVIVVLALSALIVWLLRTRHRTPVFIGLTVIAIAIVPLTPAGIAWPVVLAAALGAWLISERSASTRWVVLAIPLLVLVAVVFRYADPPSRFSDGNVWTAEPGKARCRWLPVGDTTARKHASWCGAFVSSNAEYVYIGIPGVEGTAHPPELQGLTKSSVKRLVLTDHVDRRAPRTSVVGRVTHRLGWSSISCNPLECWIGQTNFGSRIFG
jgi:hypothetical protein